MATFVCRTNGFLMLRAFLKLFKNPACSIRYNATTLTRRMRPMSDSMIDSLQARLRDFARERDWEQFHTPKNLAMALTVEASELQEIFQWLTTGDSQNLNGSQRQHASEEMADVLLYLCRLADVLGIDLMQAAEDKLKKNAEKYPADEVRGSSAKR